MTINKLLFFLLSYTSIHTHASPTELTTLPNLAGTVNINSCSGSLVAPEGYQPSDRAWILTNGHCINMGSFQNVLPDTGEVFYHTPLQNIKGLLFTGTKIDPKFKLNIQELLYATMTDTDIAIYATEETYQDIISKYNIEPFIIAKNVQNTLAIGTKIRLTSSYWQNSYVCTYEKKIYKLREAMWTWGPSLRLTPECIIDHGSSGSPLIAEGTKYIIGVINTMYENEKACDFNNPCEIDENENITTAAFKQPYGQFIDNIYSCLNSKREIDLNMPDCTLPKPNSKNKQQ